MLLQAEQMHKMTTISLKIVEVVILVKIGFFSCSACKNSYFSQLEISHVLNGPIAQNQQKCRGPNSSDQCQLKKTNYFDK